MGEWGWLRGPDNYVRSIIEPIAWPTERLSSRSYHSFLQYSSGPVSNTPLWNCVNKQTKLMYNKSHFIFYNLGSNIIFPLHLLPRHILILSFTAGCHGGPTQWDLLWLKLMSGCHLDEKLQGKQSFWFHPHEISPSDAFISYLNK